MPAPLAQPAFLPMSRAEMDRLGWRELDVLLVSGDAYVDHPSFGVPLLGRWLVSHGYRAGIVAQPRWETHADLEVMGRPRLFAGVSAGAMDSMLAHYTAFRKKRSDDAYTPGGKAGARPNRAAIVYANLVRRAFPGLPVVLGGIEASLRRLAHYDFWTDAIRRSILLDAKADLLLYGMAEPAILEVCRRLEQGETLQGVPGAVWAVSSGNPLPEDAPNDVLTLPSLADIQAAPAKLMEATLAEEQRIHQGARHAVQFQSESRAVVLAPPGPQFDGPALDALYGLPFSKRAHPAYAEKIPAEAMIQTSLTTHRGCAGGCSFCALALHQGRRIRSRSRSSILAEAAKLKALPGFTGAVSDVGGPSANMWGGVCAKDAPCARSSCLVPKPCPHFRTDQAANVELLRAVRATPGVKHVRVASGVRMDLLLQNQEACAAYVREFVGGQLKVAPEHLDDAVLARMRKPSFAVFERFLKVFQDESGRVGKEQYVIPYLMTGFPGCSDADVRRLADWLKRRNWRPQQVQCFIPLPGTVAAAMYHAGIDERGAPIPVARTDAERLRQHGLLMGESGGGEKKIGGRKLLKKFPSASFGKGSPSFKTSG